MEKGSQALARMIGISLLLGAGVLVFHPGYRKTVSAFWRGKPDTSPIAASNRDFYPDIRLGNDAVPNEK